MKNIKGEPGLLFTSLIWGTGFIACDILLEYMSPFQLLAFRFIIAAAILFVVCIKRFKLVDKSLLLWSLVFGALLYSGFTLQVVGLMYTTPSKYAFLTALSVIIVPFIAVMFFRKKIDKYSLAGALIALTGAAVLSFNLDFSVNFGDLLTICSAFFYAMHLVLMAELSKRFDAALLTFFQTLVCAVLGSAALIILGQFDLSVIHSASLPVLLYLSVACTCICFFLQAYFQRFTSEVTAVILLSTECVFAAAISVPLALEPFTANLLIGSILIFGAGIISQTKLSFLRLKKEKI